MPRHRLILFVLAYRLCLYDTRVDESDWGLRVKCHSVGPVVQVFLLLASLSSQAAILANVLSIVLASKTSVQPKKSIVGNPVYIPQTN
jgi:hypothetical protein